MIGEFATGRKRQRNEVRGKNICFWTCTRQRKVEFVGAVYRCYEELQTEVSSVEEEWRKMRIAEDDTLRQRKRYMREPRERKVYREHNGGGMRQCKKQ